MQRVAPLRFELRGSPALAVVFAVLHLASAGVAAWLPWPTWAVAALMGAILLNGAWAIWSEALRRLPQAIVGIELEAPGALRLLRRDGGRRLAQLAPGSVVLPALVVLAYREPQARWSRRIVLTPDAVGAEALRKLRISLRHPRGASPGPGGSSATPEPK